MLSRWHAGMLGAQAGAGRIAKAASPVPIKWAFGWRHCIALEGSWDICWGSRASPDVRTGTFDPAYIFATNSKLLTWI